VTAPLAGDHGPVENRGFGLYHTDGARHFSVRGPNLVCKQRTRVDTRE
jgi:hypothetical protein